MGKEYLTREFARRIILFCIYLSMMRKYILQILGLNVNSLINNELLKITIFPFTSTVFTFPIPTIFVSTGVSLRDSDPFMHSPNGQNGVVLHSIYFRPFPVTNRRCFHATRKSCKITIFLGKEDFVYFSLY